MSLLFSRSDSEACAASHASSLAPPNLPISVTCWIYVEAQPGTGETHTVWWYGRDGMDSQFLKLTFLADTEGAIKFQATFQASNNTAMATATGYATGAWHCISVVVEERTNPSEYRLRLYVDAAAPEDDSDLVEGPRSARRHRTEKENMMKSGRIAACLGAAALAAAAPAKAQDLLALSLAETRVLETACFEASVDCLMTPFFDDFMREFAAREWPLVVIEWYLDLDPDQRERLLPALAEHVDRGGRLLLVYTNLDDWPELQEFVGVQTVGDVTWVHLRNVWSVEPAHPTWAFGGFITGDEKYWADNGDFLDPGASGYTLATWDELGGPPAMTLTRDGRIITYGLDLDAFEQTAILSVLAKQLHWLLDCQADIDGDGELTFFDFLAFQNLFAAGDPGADFSFDGRLNFFDFLEFQSQFAIGCP